MKCSQVTYLNVLPIINMIEPSDTWSCSLFSGQTFLRYSLVSTNGMRKVISDDLENIYHEFILGEMSFIPSQGNQTPSVIWSRVNSVVLNLTSIY